MTQDTSKEAVERWHEELHGMKAERKLYDDQQEFVLYEDYLALAAERDALQVRLDEMIVIKDIHQTKRHEFFERAEAAEAALASARADALREAAQSLKSHWFHGTSYREMAQDAILALIDTPRPDPVRDAARVLLKENIFFGQDAVQHADFQIVRDILSTLANGGNDE
jgi:hypothetical protein